MKISDIWLPITVILLLSGCGGDATESKSPEKEPVTVTVATAMAADQAVRFSASGKIEAMRQANLSTRMMGYIRDIQVKVGDRVRQGQTLLSLDIADLNAQRARSEAAIAEAQAAFTTAEKDYQRYSRLFEEESASQKELDDMTARFRMAEARLEAARQAKQEVEAQLAYARIKAPFGGIVTNIFPKIGDMANPGQTLVALESPGVFEVKAGIPEAEISRVARGDSVIVYIEVIGEQRSGYVSELSLSARHTGGQYLATIALPDSPEGLRSGMYARVLFERTGPAGSDGTAAASWQGSVLIPQEALVHRGQLSGVYTISQENTALLRWLRLGSKQGDQVEVLSGLSPGERYIRSAEQKLYNGMPLSIQ